MNRLIYFLLAGLLAVGCVQQANTTHPKDDVAPIDSTLAATNDRHENAVLTDPVLTDSATTDSVLTDSILANLQCSDIYNGREVIPASFYKDTIETILSSRSVKTFLSENKEEIVKYNKRDTIWYTGTKANVIISNHDQVDRADTIIITRSLLNKKINIPDIDEFEIVSIYYEFEKSDTICFSIALMMPESDIGYICMYYHTNENDYIEWDLSEISYEDDE